MPSHIAFGVKIIIGNEEMKEYWLNDQCYVPINLHTKDSYVIEVELDDADTHSQSNESSKLEGKESAMRPTQRYPVTPFKIQVHKNLLQPCWVSMEMDGEHICYQLLQNPHQQTRVIDGRRCGDEIRELAFSLPLLTQQVTGAKQKRIDAAGSITVKLLEAINTGTETFRPACKTKTNYLPHGDFPQLSKQDISQKENLGAVVREGRTIMKLSYNDGNKMIRQRYIRGKVLDEITLHYRPLESLLDLGVLGPEEYSSLKASMVADVEPIAPTDNLHTNETAEEDLRPGFETVMKETTVNLPLKQEAAVNKNITAHANLPLKQEAAVNENITPHANLPLKQEVGVNKNITAHANLPLKEELSVNRNEVVSGVLVKGKNNGDDMMSHFGQMKLEVPDSADDVIYLGYERVAYTGDESVICMGDDSCYEFDITPQEISMVDLTDDVPL